MKCKVCSSESPLAICEPCIKRYARALSAGALAAVGGFLDTCVKLLDVAVADIVDAKCAPSTCTKPAGCGDGDIVGSCASCFDDCVKGDGHVSGLYQDANMSMRPGVLCAACAGKGAVHP